jgi:cap2 methyltransferase
MLKHFTLYESASVSLIFLVSCCFKTVLLVKPESSRPGNSEIYLIAQGYLKNLGEAETERLLALLAEIRFRTRGEAQPALFPRDQIPARFLSQLIEIQEELTRIQIKGIQENLSLFRSRERKKSAPSTEKAARDWIQANQVRVLNPSERLLPSKD